MADRPRIDGSRSFVWALDRYEFLEGRSDQRNVDVGQGAHRALDVLHDNVEEGGSFNGPVDAGDPYGDAGIFLEGFPNEVLHPRLSDLEVVRELDEGGFVSQGNTAELIGSGPGPVSGSQGRGICLSALRHNIPGTRKVIRKGRTERNELDLVLRHREVLLRGGKKACVCDTLHNFFLFYFTLLRRSRGTGSGLVPSLLFGGLKSRFTHLGVGEPLS